MVLAATLLLSLATGCCLFDEHGTAGHALPPGLCLTVIVASLGMPLIPPLAIGWAVSPLVASADAVARRTPDPPPRPLSL